MKIKQLYLRNYGRFEDLKIDFAPTKEKNGNVTVIVGNNGAGKSQILKALATILSWFVSKLINGSDGSVIEKGLIKNGKNDVEVTVMIDFGKDNPRPYGPLEDACWTISNVKDGRINSFSNHTKELRKTVNNFRQKLTDNVDYSLPIMMYYSIDRTLIIESNADVLSRDFEQLEGYHSSLDGGVLDFSDFIKWFRNAEDIENESKVSMKGTIKELKADSHRALNEMYDFLNYVKSSENLELEDRTLDKIHESRKNIESQLSKFQAIEEKINLISRDLSLTLVRIALENFTGFNNFHIRRQGIPTMIVEKDGEELDVNQLSQGEKSLLALVGDIARRLAILNPSLNNPLEGEGVVMIDEVDLHLHPKWQHNLIDKLVKTFPNVQFILTTHSPHIISDTPDILVYALDNGELEELPNIYGQDVNTVLTKVFDVDIRDSEVEVKLNNIRRAISHKDYLSAEKGIEELSEKMPADDVELLKCRLMLAQAKVNDKKDNELEHADD